MNLTEWSDHSLTNPARDAETGEEMERFVRQIDRDLKPCEDRDCEIGLVADALRRHFNLKPPVREAKILTFLEVAGIGLKQDAPNTTFIYNQVQSRWQIYVQPTHPNEWSREIFHETWEVLFWRCFHRIHWWKAWAARKGYFVPHEKADEFAYSVLLPPQSVAAQARKYYYDVWSLAKHYAAPANHAFRALQSYSTFPHPTMLAIVRLDMPAPKQAPTLFDSLFDEETVYAEVRQKATLQRRENGQQPSQLDPVGYRATERTFSTFRKHFRKDSILKIAPDDIVYQYCRQPEPKLWEVRHLFGLDLDTPVNVITRQSPIVARDIFLQVVPLGCADDFLPKNPNNTLSDALTYLRSWQECKNEKVNKKLTPVQRRLP